MPRRTPSNQSVIEPREWRTIEEIELAIGKLQRRIADLESLDVSAAVLQHSGVDDVVVSNVRETIREVFGQQSPEFQEHQLVDLWGGPLRMGMSQDEIIQSKHHGRIRLLTMLHGLIGRLDEKRQELSTEGHPRIKTVINYLNLHHRIADVAVDLFRDGHHWEAVFNATKVLINYIKERSGQHDLDGTGLVRRVFSKNNPILAFNDLSNQTDTDEQEGMMHLYEGVVQAIRNPGGHTFPKGTEQRALEYLSLLSLLAYRVQEAEVRR